jgi:RNA recognition motif-containing protein
MNHFQSCGEITDVKIIRNERPYGFITFSSIEEANKGVE